MIETIYKIAGIIIAIVALWRLIIVLRERGKIRAHQNDISISRHLSQKDVDKGIIKLREMIVKEHSFDLIIAISSGGAVIGGMLSTLLNVPLNVIMRSNPRLQENYPLKSETIYFNKEFIKGKRVLIVDDIVRSGSTFKRYMEEIQNENPLEIITASLLLAGEHSVVVPNFYVYRAKKVGIRMPWDYHKKVKLELST